MIWIITSVIALGSFIFLYLIWNFNYWSNRNVPGPKPMPLYGNLPAMVNQKRPLAYEMDEIYKKYRPKLPFIGIFQIRTPQLMLLSPQLIKDILIKNFKYFHDNEFGDMVDKNSDPLFGRNPFMLSGEEWKEKRAEITPAFTNSRIKAMVPLIEDTCTNMTKYIKNNISKPFEVKELCAKYTTDVVSSCIFSVDAQSFTNEKEATIREKGRELMTPSLKLMFIMLFTSIFPFFKSLIKISFIPKHLEDFFTGLMKDAIKYREDQKVKRVDYLEYLISLKKQKQITELDMAAHGVTFFLDGFETSSVAMSFALYEIANNKSIQDILREEIRNAVDEKGQISYENYIELPYLDQIVNETLRLWPPAPILSKKCTQSIQLPLSSNHDVLIEKGICATIPIWSIHRDPENYEDPETFNPDRFSLENGGLKKYRDHGVYYAFGDGPRICIGMRFAFAQVKRGIIEIIEKFEISVDERTVKPLKIDAKQFITTIKGGLWLNFKPI